MRAILEQIASKMGVDRAIFFVLLGRSFSLFAQPLTIYLVASYFSKAEQGYYYTFANILTVSIFLELGLGYLLTQYASHEFAHLSWGEKGALFGSTEHLSRLLSLARKALKWYGGMAVLLMASLAPGGLLFFGASQASAAVDYSVPWVILVFFSVMNLLVNPTLAIIEGCGKIAELHRMRLHQAMFGAFAVWGMILSGGGLLAAAVLAASNLAVSLFWLWQNFSGLIRQFVGKRDLNLVAHISWRAEILPMQWRIGLSWMSGYLATQLFNPLLFHYQGAAVAGLMGMSITIANVALTISIAWISTKFPLYGAMIQNKQYRELDAIALKGTFQALFFSIVLSGCILIAVWLIKLYMPQFGDRMLSVMAIGALLFSNVLTLLITSMACYLRAHKIEPLLAMAIVSGGVMALTAWVCARFSSADIMTFAIAGVNLFLALPITVLVFVRKRKELHKEPVV
jgi:hypothetical protein